MRTRAMPVSWALLAAASAVWGCVATVQDGQPSVTVLGSDAADRGRAEFVRSCASCHGVDGRGGGPVAAVLRSPPPDLTTLAVRATGRFPRERVIAVMTGDMPEAAHGTREMPVWSDRFGEAGDGASVAASLYARERMEAIVTYLASIQRAGP